MEGNFNQALKLLSVADVHLTTWTKKKRDKYTCKNIQDEILRVMGQRVLRHIACV